jgi:hypothetical protein
MSDSYVKDIVYDLIGSKLKIKELEDKLTKLEAEKEELTSVNIELKAEVNKWKTQIVAYINDYRDIYTTKEETVDNNVENQNVNPQNVSETVEEEDDEEVINESKKTRSEYMKEYMRNKRKNKKEELKNIIVNKK